MSSLTRDYNHTGELNFHLFPVANKSSSIPVEQSDESYTFYRYCADEWSDWDTYGLFDKVNQLIAKLYEEQGDDFYTYKESLLNQALEALNELESEGLFGAKDDNRFLIVWVTDSDHDIRVKSAEKLNTLKVFKEFKALL